MSKKDERSRDLKMYIAGFIGAVTLTTLSFLTAILQPVGSAFCFTLLAVLAVLQLIVHLRFFLHIDLSRQKSEELQLILFTGLIITIMITGTVWLLGNLMMRMM